jgi:hypothetical protein
MNLNVLFHAVVLVSAAVVAIANVPAAGSDPVVIARIDVNGIVITVQREAVQRKDEGASIPKQPAPESDAF